MKQIIFILALILSIFIGCAPVKSPERQGLKDAIWKHDSLRAVALMDSVRLKRQPDTTNVDTISQ